MSPQEKNRMIGERIRKHREEQGLTQGRLAQLVNVKQGTLGTYERGQRGVPSATLARIARALSIPLEDLTESLNSQRGHRYRDAALTALQTGQHLTAFEHARDYWRWATDARDPLEISRSDALLKTAGANLAPEDILGSDLKSMHFESLRAMLVLARIQESWALADALNRAMIEKAAPASSEWYKAIRNRARIVLERGAFADAVYWYDQALTEPDMPFTARVPLELSRQVALTFLGRQESERLAQLKAHATVNPMSWQIYWWCVTHNAWWTGDWTTLGTALQEAKRSYPGDWSETYQMVLLGVEAAWAAYQYDDRRPLDRLRHLIRTGATEALSGYGSAPDLWHDWLLTARDCRDPEAIGDWASYLINLFSAGRAGMAIWFLDRLAPLAFEDFPPIAAARLRMFREQHHNRARLTHVF